MSILDIDNNVIDNTALIWEWLKTNINDGQYNYLTSRNLISIENGIINVKADISLKPLLKSGNFPEHIKFGHIYGNFSCSGRGMTDLKGTPEVVEGNFNCSYNKLKNFTNGPKVVGRCYYAKGNPLSLEQLYPLYELPEKPTPEMINDIYGLPKNLNINDFII